MIIQNIGVIGHLLQSAEVGIVAKYLLMIRLVSIVDGSQSILRVTVTIDRGLIRSLLLQNIIHWCRTDCTH